MSIGVADNRVGLVRHGHLLTLLQYARESMVNRVRDMSVPTRTIVFGADAAYVATRDYRGFSIADSGEIRPLAGLPSAVHIGADPTARHVCATDRAGALRCSGQNQAEARATQPIALALR